jgi:virulence-associated protein VagC
MKTAEVFDLHDEQVVRLPEGFRFTSSTFSIRKEGDAVILEPTKPQTWPAGFFEAIRIDDPAFERPDQGSLPPAPSLS